MVQLGKRSGCHKPKLEERKDSLRDERSILRSVEEMAEYDQTEATVEELLEQQHQSIVVLKSSFDSFNSFFDEMDIKMDLMMDMLRGLSNDIRTLTYPSENGSEFSIMNLHPDSTNGDVASCDEESEPNVRQPNVQPNKVQQDETLVSITSIAENLKEQVNEPYAHYLFDELPRPFLIEQSDRNMVFDKNAEQNEDVKARLAQLSSQYGSQQSQENATSQLIMKKIDNLVAANHRTPLVYSPSDDFSQKSEGLRRFSDVEVSESINASHNPVDEELRINGLLNYKGEIMSKQDVGGLETGAIQMFDNFIDSIQKGEFSSLEAGIQLVEKVEQSFPSKLEVVEVAYKVIDEMLPELTSAEQNKRVDAHEELILPIVVSPRDLSYGSVVTKVSSFNFSSKSNLEEEFMFVDLKNHVFGADCWVDGILMFIFDPGGGFSPLMDSDVLKNDNALVEMGKEANEKNRGNFIALVEVIVNKNNVWKVLENAFTYEKNLIGANGYLEYELLVNAQLDCILVFHFAKIVVNWGTSSGCLEGFWMGILWPVQEKIPTMLPAFLNKTLQMVESIEWRKQGGRLNGVVGSVCYELPVVLPGLKLLGQTVAITFVGIGEDSMGGYVLQMEQDIGNLEEVQQIFSKKDEIEWFASPEAIEASLFGDSSLYHKGYSSFKPNVEKQNCDFWVDELNVGLECAMARAANVLATHFSLNRTTKSMGWMVWNEEANAPSWVTLCNGEAFEFDGFNPLFDSFTEEGFKRLRSSPPSTFKFLRDAEKKVIQHSVEEAGKGVLNFLLDIQIDGLPILFLNEGIIKHAPTPNDQIFCFDTILVIIHESYEEEVLLLGSQQGQLAKTLQVAIPARLIGKFILRLTVLILSYVMLKNYVFVLTHGTYDKLENFMWDPGVCSVLVHILEDNDVFERVGKDIVFTDITLVIRRYDHERQMGCLDDIGLIPKTPIFSTGELEHYIWDPGSFVSVS